jgi:hypothetical protein
VFAGWNSCAPFDPRRPTTNAALPVVGVTGAECGFVIDLWAFPRATVQ